MEERNYNVYVGTGEVEVKIEPTEYFIAERHLGVCSSDLNQLPTKNNGKSENVSSRDRRGSRCAEAG